ncbi:hypothetical protein ACWGJ2_39230 [Streptomyces sp. NPDC054796]
MPDSEEPLFRYERRGKYPGYKLNPRNPTGLALIIVILVGFALFAAITLL